MPTFETIAIVTFAGLALSASPGPSMLYVLSRSIGQSHTAGLVSAAGLAVGGFLHVIAAALGLAALFNYFPNVFLALKYAGAVYLIYLGIGMFRDSGGSDPSGVERVKRVSLRRVFYQGILVEALNPKTLLFFVAFLPQFVDQQLGSVGTQMLILGALVPLTAVPSDLIVAFTGGGIAQRIARNRDMSRLLSWLAGAILIGLGLNIFIS